MKNKIEQIQQEYSTLNRSIDAFGYELTKQITQIFEENNVSLGFPIDYRTKSWDSIQRKAQVLNVKTLLDIQDLCGLRFVLLFKRDIPRIKKLISDTFKIQKEYDTHEKLASDQFGYSSLHLVIKMPDSWFTIPTLKGFKGLKAEIQIRTLAQHTWAAASHVLQYKTEENVPKSILRSIYRVSAILETVDIEFERFLEEREKYLEHLTKQTTEQISKVKLNVNSLEKILDENLPAKNKTSDESYSRVLEELKAFGIEYPNDLVTFIKKHIDEALRNDYAYAREMNEDHFFNHTGLVRSCMELENPNKWRLIVKK